MACACPYRAAVGRVHGPQGSNTPQTTKYSMVCLRNCVETFSNLRLNPLYWTGSPVKEAPHSLCDQRMGEESRQGEPFRRVPPWNPFHHRPKRGHPSLVSPLDFCSTAPLIRQLTLPPLSRWLFSFFLPAGQKPPHGSPLPGLQPKGSSAFCTKKVLIREEKSVKVVM